MFENILVVVEAAEESSWAVEFGVRLARQHGSQLRAIAVMPLPEYGGTVGEVEDARQKGYAQAEALMRGARQIAESLGKPITTEILFGHPAKTICDYAAEHGFDLIVMARRSGPGRFELKVARHAPCPVFIVAEREIIKYAGGDARPQWELRKEHRRTLRGPAKMLRIYVGEADRFHGRPLYEAILLKLRQLDIAGATVYRGIMGYGAGQRIRKRGLLSHDLPMLIVAIDAEEKIRQALPSLEEMIQEGLIALSNVDVIKYTYSAGDFYE